MEEYVVTGRPARAPIHPGELIGEILEEHFHLPVADAARRMRVSRQSLHAVLSGQSAVTPGMALRIGKLFNRDPQIWLNMQVAHDLWKAEQSMARELDAIKSAEMA